MGCGASQDANESQPRDLAQGLKKERRPIASEQDMLRNAAAVREKYTRERDQEDEAVLRHLEESRSLPGSRVASIRGSAANSRMVSPEAFPLGGDRANATGVGGLRPSFDIGDEDDEGVIGTVLSGGASRAGSRRSLRSMRSARSSFHGGASPSLHGQSSLSVFDLIESDDDDASGAEDPLRKNGTGVGLDRAALCETAARDGGSGGKANVETWVQAQACTSAEGSALMMLPAPIVGDDAVSSGVQSTSPTPRRPIPAGIGGLASPSAEDPPDAFPHVPSGSAVVGPLRDVSLASSAHASPLPLTGAGRAGCPLSPSTEDITATGSFARGLGARRHHGDNESGGASRSATPLETMQSKLLPNGFAMGGTSRRPRHA